MQTEFRNSSAFFFFTRKAAYEFNRKKMVVTKYINVPKVAQVGCLCGWVAQFSTQRPESCRTPADDG